MQNQHQMIKGYRDLSHDEIDLMNKVKAHEAATQALIGEVRSHLEAQQKDAQAANQIGEQMRIAHAEPARWLSIARTDFQTGTMALVRAIAQPGT